MTTKYVRLSNIDTVNGVKWLHFNVYGCNIEGSRVKPLLIVPQSKAGVYLKTLGLEIKRSEPLFRVHPVLNCLNYKFKMLIWGLLGSDYVGRS